MNTAAKLSVYGAALALVVAGAYVTGTAVGPLVPVSAVPGAESTTHGDGHSGTVVGTTIDQPGGLASNRSGYTLIPTDPTLSAATIEDFSFRITGPDGAAVTAFDVEHDKRMHLIVVRRDTTGFQHVHPEMAPDGTWSVPLTLLAAGSYRAFADFTPAGGEGLTLGTDLFVPGTFEPVAHEPSRTTVVDGYQVELSGDLAYLHVHPEGAPGDGRTTAGPEIEFVAGVPSAGNYRLFLDFSHGDVVRTAEFTMPTAAGGGAHDGGHR